MNSRHLLSLFLALALSGCANDRPKVYTVREASKSEIAEAKKSAKKTGENAVVQVGTKNKKTLPTIVQVIDLGPTFKDGKILPGGRYYRIVDQGHAVLKSGMLEESEVKKSAADSKSEKRVTKGKDIPSRYGEQAAQLSVENSEAQAPASSDPFMDAFSPIPPPKTEEQPQQKQFDDPRTALEQYKSKP